MRNDVKFLTANPNFCMMRAYFLAASRESSSLLAPVHTILPDENIRAVVLGSLILIMTAANRFGLYSAFLNENYEIFIYFVIIATRYYLACKAIFFRSSLQLKLTVDTMFLWNEKKTS